ncbi:MAG: glutamine amidotransferase-related protein [Alphaproteobacteria bacterium]
MSAKVLLIVHERTSDTGRVGRVLAEHGYIPDVRCPRRGSPLPATMDEHAGAVIFGGPQSANDCTKDAGIKAELDWIPRALASDKPFLGICLGAQLLSRVLGGRVAFHCDGLYEIGYVPIRPTTAWGEETGFPSHFYQWHKEGFEIPASAQLLAEGNCFPNQAFRYGANVYGLQFHPEVTRHIVDRWTSNGYPSLGRPEAQPREAQLEANLVHDQAIDAWARSFILRWIGAAS